MDFHKYRISYRNVYIFVYYCLYEFKPGVNQTMKIIVTGGAGFIGSWVCRAYISEGHEVLVIDNLSTGNIDNIPAEADFLELDIMDRSGLEKAFTNFSPDVVNHHAAQINVRHSVSDPVFDAETNIIGSVNVMENCRIYNIKKIIFSSTGGAIYGQPRKIPANEDTEARPFSPYGTSKLCVENYLGLYKRLHGLDYIALRYANVYGERQSPSGEAGVISIFCNNILKELPCIVYGDGYQTRDYLYCGDVAEANLKALSTRSGIYNIGTGKELSLNNLVSRLKSISGIEFDVIYEKEREGDVRNISLDNTRAREFLGWIPTTDIHKGLLQTWNWFSEQSSPS